MANPNWPDNKIVSSAPAETCDIAGSWSASWKVPCCVLLRGPMGAGKTEFVRGLARGLGCQDAVSSPTFPIVHEYSGGRFPLYHFDFYRLTKIAEVFALGFEEYLAAGAVVAEWGERFPGVFPDSSCLVEIRIQGAEERGIKWFPEFTEESS